MCRAADVLNGYGLARSDRVLVMMDNSPDWLRSWSGIAAIGAITVPLNTAFRGPILQRFCELSCATHVIASGEFAERVREVSPRTICIEPEELRQGQAITLELNPPLQHWDLNAIMFTSGTTGASKGVVTPWLQTFMGGWPIFGAGAGLQPADRWLIDLPLFHVGGQQALLAAIDVGASVAIRGRFTAGNYWSTAKAIGATRSMVVASMLDMLIDQPPASTDRDHSIRSMVVCPVSPGRMMDFMERFGIAEIRTALGSTETGAPIFGLVEEEPIAGWVGRARPGIEVQVVDDHDVRVAEGTVGQLLLRSRRAWEISPEYLADAEATRAAWMHGWFHTGDAVRMDTEGNIYWIDRIKDTIRRRGENVSSVEVEQVILQYPGIAEVACVPAQDELGDEEIKAWMVVKDGGELDLPDLVRMLADQLPYFMVPRFFEVIHSLPRTVTMRVQKNRLRDMSPGRDAWDRVMAGMVVGRSGLREPSEGVHSE
jgi:crotonobetaine/carnitine-CoA ligase